MGKYEDLTVGQEIGILTVLREGPQRAGRRAWQCRCKCGRMHLVAERHLKRKAIKSCGRCLRLSSPGMKKKYPQEYGCWNQMQQRCNNPNVKSYKYYGGRGIHMCKSWKQFDNYIQDMGPRPSAAHSIDRIDNEGGYCKENCRCATRQEQANNKRDNIRLTIDGVTDTIANWSRKYRVPLSTIRGRLRHGWDPAAAVKTPKKHNRPHTRILEYNGESLSVSAWARKLGVSRSRLVHRLSRGLSVSRTLAT